MGAYQRIFYLFLCLMLLDSTRGVATTRIRGTNTHYQQGDWITYASTRFVRHIALGDRFVYFATTGGITRYNFFSYTWEYPWTVSNGLVDNNIFLVAYDFNTGYLWCVSEQSISYLESASQLWRNHYFDEIGLHSDEYIASIGFGDDGRVYFVTNEDRWYSSINTAGQFYSSSNENDQVRIQWFSEKMAQVEDFPYLHMGL